MVALIAVFLLIANELVETDCGTQKLLTHLSFVTTRPSRKQSYAKLTDNPFV